MPIFNTAIKTLSEMCLMENGVEVPKKTTTNIAEELKEELKDMPCLSEEECIFPASLVPVRENSRLGKYLIEMEDLSRFMITNQIHSARDAVGYILKENGLDGYYDHVALVIDEASILDEIADLGLGADNSNQYSQTGLGTGLWGDQKNVMHYRRMANSKQMLDLFTNRYGLPFVKKNYNVGLMNEDCDCDCDDDDDDDEHEEDVQLKVNPDDQVIHEKPEKGGKRKYRIPTDDEIMNDLVDDNPDVTEDDEDDKYTDDVTSTTESAYQKHLQYLRDVSAGKYDDELI